MRIHALLVTLSLLWPSAGGAQAPLSRSDAARLDSIALTAKERNHLPGLTYTVVREGAIVRERGFGLADVETGVTATPATVYPIASLTKSLTAVAVFQLIESGRLDLDAPVQHYLPSYPRAEPPMTTRHLLWHSSGIRHYRTEADDDAEYANRRHYPTLEAAVAEFASDSLLHAPGGGLTYSSFAYAPRRPVDRGHFRPCVHGLPSRERAPAGRNAKDALS